MAKHGEPATYGAHTGALAISSQRRIRQQAHAGAAHTCTILPSAHTRKSGVARGLGPTCLQGALLPRTGVEQEAAEERHHPAQEHAVAERTRFVQVRAIAANRAIEPEHALCNQA